MDDQVILRESLKFIIEQDSEIKVVGLAANGQEAFELCQKLKPNIVLMDIQMPVCDGIKGTKLIKEKFNDIKVIILTTFNDEENIKDVLENGADGYVLKDIKPEELIHGIKGVQLGLGIMHKNTYGLVLKQFEANKNSEKPESLGKKDNPTNQNLINLTQRELSVINLIVEGLNNKKIAEKLFLSEGTVKILFLIFY